MLCTTCLHASREGLSCLIGLPMLKHFAQRLRQSCTIHSAVMRENVPVAPIPIAVSLSRLIPVSCGLLRQGELCVFQDTQLRCRSPHEQAVGDVELM